mmetsp:Transcript_15494/g.33587  ORF Transcript_15494/g.33587 Transcript_15494/m.33587 type:complete len:547 (+) Transcript_15494:99-1739(+)
MSTQVPRMNGQTPYQFQQNGFSSQVPQGGGGFSTQVPHSQAGYSAQVPHSQAGYSAQVPQSQMGSALAPPSNGYRSHAPSGMSQTSHQQSMGKLNSGAPAPPPAPPSRKASHQQVGSRKNSIQDTQKYAQPPRKRSLLSDKAERFNSDDDDWSEEEEEDDQPEAWYQRRDMQMLFGGLLLLVIVGILLQQSLYRGSPEPRYVTMAPAVLTTAAPIFTTSRDPLLPIEQMHDDNLCLDGEELYGGLCYKQCALMTNNSYPIRTSSWTCCEKHPCGLSNQKGEVGSTIICNGFDVDRDGNCPHSPGACLVNEEFYMGMCYKKCSILTNGQFPHRVAPATCCQESGAGCMDFRKDATNFDFAVGGGGSLNPDWAKPHYPDPNLTEAGGQTSSGDSGAVFNLPSNFGGQKGEGERCFEDEELYAGLCYLRCAIMTNNAYPIRTSSWTCCESQPCGLSNQKGSVGNSVVCNGYDVAGQNASTIFGHSCPHAPKSCDPDQDELWGVCYKSCSSLTQGRFSHRVGPATCCNQESIQGCFSLEAISSSTNFDTY